MFDYDMPLEGLQQTLETPTKTSTSPPKARWKKTMDSRIAMANRSSLLRPAPSHKLSDWQIVGMECDAEPKVHGSEEERKRVQFDPKVLVHEVSKCGQCCTTVADLVTGECPCLYCSTKACDLPDLLPDHPCRRKETTPPVRINQSRPREDITPLMLDTTPPGSYNPFTESIISDFHVFHPIM